MSGTFSPPPRKPLNSDPGMHHGTCVTHVPWCMPESLIHLGRENIPGIPGACATRNFTYLARGLYKWFVCKYGLPHRVWVLHTRVSKPGHHWFTKWLVITCLAPSHYVEHCRLIVYGLLETSKFEVKYNHFQTCDEFKNVCNMWAILPRSHCQFENLGSKI